MDGIIIPISYELKSQYKSIFSVISAGKHLSSNSPVEAREGFPALLADFLRNQLQSHLLRLQCFS